MPSNSIPTVMRNCETCGWSGYYNMECDCWECKSASAAHLAQHNGQPQRKPLQRASAHAEAQAAIKSPLADAIERRIA